MIRIARVNTPLPALAVQWHAIRMKKNHHRAGILICPLIATALLSSCIIPEYPRGARYSSNTGRYNVYSALPDTYVGGAYYQGGRYYSGGNYQTGSYRYDGRIYTNRYYHDGKYIYGGVYNEYQPKHRDDDRSKHRDDGRLEHRDDDQSKYRRGY